MLVRGDIGFPSLVFLVVVVFVPTVVFVVRRKWRHAAARREEIERLLVLASEESARAEFEATEGYCYTSTTTPSSTVTVSASTSASVSLDAPLKRQYECAVCFCPTTTRCAKCKAVRYCSGKCQIIHWRQGHKDECRPYVVVSPINDVGGSSYRQRDGKDYSVSFETKAPHTATLAERFPVNLHHGNDVGVEALAHQPGSNSTSESTFPLSHGGRSYFATPTKSSAGATVGNFETVKSEHHTLVKPARKSTGLGKINQNSNLSDEDTQPGTSSSQTDDGSNEPSFSGPSTNSSGFWDRTIRNTKSSIDELDDVEAASFGEAANGYMTDLTAKGGYNSTIMNGFNATKIISGGSDVTGLGGKKSNNDSNLSKEMCNYGSKSRRPPTCNSVILKPRDVDAGSYLPESDFGEFKNSPPGAVSHRAAGAGQRSTLKDAKAFGGLPPPGPERSNHSFSNKSDPAHASNFMEIGSSPSRTSYTYLTTFTSGDASHSTKPAKIDDDNHRVTTCSSQLAENSQSVRSGLRTSKLKVVDQLKPSKSSRHKSLEGGSETPPRYSCKGLFSYEMFVKLYNWKKVELQPCGLKNCGNSCYANAVLQCLVYTPPLTAYLLEGFHSKACDKRGWCFMCEFEGLVLKAKNGNSPLSPIRMLTHIENIGSNLGHGREEDAHEFLRYVIDALQSVCIKEAGTNTFNSLEEETTLIGLTFGGYLRSKIKCMRCGGKSEQHERMMDLTVEIEGNIRTLEEALDKFTCTEILDGENKYKCSRCKSYEKAKKKLSLLEVPNVLTIALKRFQSGKFGKLNKSILFPEILDMAPYVSGTSDKSPIYRLYGVVVHVDTMNAAFSGHYVCYVKNVQNRWFKIDDSMVSEVDLRCVLNKGAYMLLYARCSPRAPRSIRSSLINQHDPRRHKTPASFTSRFQANEPWDACNYHLNFQPQARHRSLEEESSSSSDNSGFFSESCSCSTESSQRDSSSIEDHVSGDWERDSWNTTNNGGGGSSGSWRSMNLNLSDSDTSSTTSFPSPLYSRLAHLYGIWTNGISRRRDDDHKECRKIRL